MKKNRIIYLDLIRIVSFLFITLYHFTVTTEIFGIHAPIDFYKSVSHILAPQALEAFLMISGAALIYQYADGLSLKEFYKKRFLGIFPLFWLAYLFAFLDFFYQAKTMPEAPKINFLLTVFGMDGYLNDYLPTFYMVGEWFLGMLIMLYLVFPIYRIVMLKCKYILPAVFLAASVGLLFYNPFPMVIEKNLMVCSLYFVLGMLIEMIRKETEPKKFATGRRIAAITGGILFLLMLFAEQKALEISGYIKIFIRTVSCYMILMEAAEWIRKEKTKELIVSIGRHSYAFFLVHHVFLNRYLAHFAGTNMSGSNTLVLLLSSFLYIYLLAVALDKIYGGLRRAVTGWLQRE
ncbi:MAG: acyltransferase [Lachnospiraceae bacterium]|nr:acyltransferase [Lachnospiraceae bacterium]